MDLATYLARQNLTDAQFAAVIDRNRSTVYRLQRGQIPSAELMRIIADKTSGMVQPADFIFGAKS